MDSLTHGLLGAAGAYALFGRRLGLRAAGVGAVAALAPDLDSFIRSDAEPLMYVEYHRQFTHSLPVAPLGALAVSLIWSARQRFRADWKVIWACALAAWLSHCLLDASTTYGTELFWPVGGQRVAWNLVSIVDPIFTLGLLGGVIAALKLKRPSLAAGALAFCGLYLAAGGIQRERAAAAQRLLADERGHVIERSEVMPGLANNVVWRTLYEHQGRIYSDRIRVGWFSAPTVCEGASRPRETVETLTPFEQERNEGRRAFERFARFSNNWVARSPGAPGVLGDMRYSLSTQAFDPIWGIEFIEPGAPAPYRWVSRTRDRKIDLREMWDEIRGRGGCHRPLYRRSRGQSGVHPGRGGRGT